MTVSSADTKDEALTLHRPLFLSLWGGAFMGRVVTTDDDGTLRPATEEEIQFVARLVVGFPQKLSLIRKHFTK